MHLRTNYLINYDLFKCIAIIAMVIDHIGKYFFPDLEILRVIGRIAAPIFFFLVGYSKSQRLDRYILLYAVILQAVEIVFSGNYFVHLNVLFTILLLRYANKILIRFNNYDFIIFFVCVAFVTLPFELFIEYGMLSFLFALLGISVREGRDGKVSLYFKAGTITSLYAIYQLIGFKFSLVSSLYFVVFMLFLIIALVHFKSFNKSYLNYKIITYTAKYSLLIYFIHKSLFIILTA